MEPYVHSRFFEAHMHGFSGELAVLDLQRKADYFKLCSSLFVLEPEMAVDFINAFIRDPSFARNSQAVQAITYCLHRAVEALPTSAPIIRFAADTLDDAALKKRAGILEALSLTDGERRKMSSLAGKGEEQADMLGKMLKENPHHVEAAELLLQLETEEAMKRLAFFQCPKALQEAWNSHKFLFYSRRGLFAEALEMWPALAEESKKPFTLVQAGCSFLGAGEKEMAKALFHKALRQDASLTPVRLRLDALERPATSAVAVPERSVTVCLFSWNKAVDLERTLRSLALSRLCGAKVRLLLNGCTDDSKERAESTRSVFAGTDFEIIELPVNVGVAAARNWLLSLPETVSADYVVFADDDIEVPENWLVDMLLLAESDPGIGVVGGKTVFPTPHTSAKKLQYLYRVAGLTEPGLFKFSPGVPSENSFDTGLYTFIRPCLTVMGCLVLLRGSILRDVGLYDIRFNPSQVEDMDHDLSVALKGYKILYHGGVTTIHHRNSGGVAHDNPASIWLNHLKMSCKRQKDLPRLREVTDSIT